jgi:hypothetical protein
MPQRNTARLTGALYLIIILCGLFGEAVVRGTLVVRGDPTATAANLLASEGLFRLGFASDLLMFLCDVAVAVLLYALLRPVHRIGAQVMAALQLVGAAIYGANLLNHFAALVILGGGGALADFDVAQTRGLALLFLDLHKAGYDLGLVFFGAHCVVLGWLAYASGFMPRLLGVLSVLAGIGYLVGSGVAFLAPAAADGVAWIYAFPQLGETLLCLWLIFRGRGAPQG